MAFQRYQQLLNRRAPKVDRVFNRFEESYEKALGEYTRYILGALKPVDGVYTKKLQEEGDRIKNQLESRLKSLYSGIMFRRQGSVSNLTHIRYASDVDVLVLIDKYITLEPPQQPRSPYKGNPIDDLDELRKHCVSNLKMAFPAAIIDDSGSTSVEISGGSLICKLDIVPSNWYDTIAYSQSGQEYDRGVQVLDRDKRIRNKNYPFIFNHRISQSDIERSGITRMLIRLLKTIKADCEEEGKEVSFSSFDICSIVYRMPSAYLIRQLNLPLEIVGKLILWIHTLFINESVRNSIKVVDDSRLIFDEDKKLSDLKIILDELNMIYQKAYEEQHGKTLLTEAHLY